MENNSNTTSSKGVKPYKVQTANQGTFETYCLWKSLPALMRFPPVDKDGKIPTPKEFVASMGIEDERVQELCELKYQSDFARKYDIAQETLSDWNKTQEVRDSLSDVREWARTLSKNAIFSLYNTVMKTGSSSEVKLFLQVVEGWEEKQKVEHTHKGIDKFIIVRNEQPKTTTEGTSDSMGTN